MKKLIVQRESEILRQIAKEVPTNEIKTEKIQKILKDMKEALHQEEDGVAIAAPQIGVSLRIFVVSGQALYMIKNKNIDEEKLKTIEDLVYINPVIKKLSKSKSKVEEGCLSVRWLYGQVERNNKATVQAFDQNGKQFEKGASGLLAQIFQHEIDHLNGILFIDKATELENIPPEK